MKTFIEAGERLIWLMFLTVIIAVISAFCLGYIYSNVAYGTGIAGEAEIIQHKEVSTSLIAEIFQEDDEAGNWAFIEQEGENSEADILQIDGENNGVDTEQRGNNLFADILQTGRRNKALIQQFEGGHEAFIRQEGTNNEAEISQTSLHSRAIITQHGNNNKAVIIQRKGSF